MGEATSLWSVRAVATQISTFPTDAKVVGAVTDGSADLLSTHDMGRHHPPRLVLTRSCLIAAPIHVADAPELELDGRPGPWVRIASAQGGRGCTTRGSWELPPQTGAVAHTPTQSLDTPSQDQVAEETLDHHRVDLEELRMSLREQQEEIDAQLAEIGEHP